MFIESKETDYIYRVIAIDYVNKMYKIDNRLGWSNREWWPMSRFTIVEDKEPYIIENEASRENRNLKKEVEALKNKIKELEEAQPHE